VHPSSVFASQPWLAYVSSSARRTQASIAS